MAYPAFSAVVAGGGVVGSAVALALARRGLKVTLVEAAGELATGATATSAGVLHTGFDAPPGELETRLLVRGAQLCDGLLDVLGVPVLRCGAVMADAPLVVAADAARNGVEARVRRDGALEIPGEAVTDPVHLTLALAAAAQAAGAEVVTGFRVRRVGRGGVVISDRQEIVVGDVVVNCAGAAAHEVARMAGDGSFEIEVAGEELLVFEAALSRIVFGADGGVVCPTVDGHVIAERGALALHPPLGALEPVAAFTAAAPAGRWVVRSSRTRPEMVHAVPAGPAGLSAALGIAEHVADLVAPGRRERPLVAGEVGDYERPWWARAAHVAAA